jgi:hypothetical protein
MQTSMVLQFYVLLLRRRGITGLLLDSEIGGDIILRVATLFPKFATRKFVG